jgi:hypothetical protein
VRGWMQEAGLRDMTRTDTPFNNTLIVGVKAKE